MDQAGQKLIIVCGLPGSGKTTLAIDLGAKLQAFRLNPDDWMAALHLDLYDNKRRARIEALQWQIGQQLLARGQVVIIEWGTWGRSERDALRIRARALGAKVELYYLAVTEEILFDRITRAGMEDPPIKREDIARWMKIFQVPTAEEMAFFDKVVTISA